MRKLIPEILMGETSLKNMQDKLLNGVEHALQNGGVDAEKYLKKGSSVYIEGKIRTNKWVDKDENTRYKTEILADKLNMLGRSGNSEDNNTPSTEDDLPF